MLVTDVRAVELGIVTALTAALAIAIPCGTPSSAPGMPAPEPEPIRVRQTATAPIACDAPGISTVVFRGHVNSLDDDMMATFHFRFADLPDRYTVMTGAKGGFEVRVPRHELNLVDLCDLPTSGTRAASFADAHLTISYDLTFER